MPLNNPGASTAPLSFTSASFPVYARIQAASNTLGIALDLPALRERSLDVELLRVTKPIAGEPFPDDLNVEALYQDQLVLAAGSQSRWALSD